VNKKYQEIYITRIERFQDRIAKLIITDSIQLGAKYYSSKDPIPFNSISKNKFRKIKEGNKWGETWGSAWFHLTGSIPKSWKGKKIVAHLDFSGEGLVHKSDGTIIQGITIGSVFDSEFSRDIVHLYKKCKGGERVELFVETAANGLFGVFTEPDPDTDSPKRYGHYDAYVNKIDLAVFNEELWHLWLDIKILYGLTKTLPEKSVRRSRIIKCVNDAIDAFLDNPANCSKSKNILKKELNKKAAPSDLTVTAVGHAHIDTAWLWPVRETIRKCARTFSSQLKLIKEYPDYIFGASQPQHYAFIKEHYPRLFKQIKMAVKDSRWDVQGGMWVEADCNLISGESLVRQILHGKNFFQDEFGIDVDNLWLPDVFGYSASLPQILRQSGINYFLTQKMSWNQFNEFPHHSFKWQGIDGSEVITHFPPENTYNSQLGTDYLVPAQDNFKEKDYIDEFISLFGVGDGGGGPKEENIELGIRMKNLEGSPKVKFGSAKDFFKRLSKHKNNLPKWVGELYLELHRGTLTTQAKVKKSNRRLEYQLKALEFIWSHLPIKNYPAKEIDSIWKTVLRNQFHDIIPGSSITKVYKDTHEEYEKIFSEINDLTTKAARKLFKEDEDSITLYNCLHYHYDDVIVLPNKFDSNLTDNNGNAIPVQKENNNVIAQVKVPPYSFVTLRKSSSGLSKSNKSPSRRVENDLVCYKFSKDGLLLSGYDKECKREILTPKMNGNQIVLYEDYPNNWDAWDIDLFYKNCVIDKAKSKSLPANYSGSVRQKIDLELSIGNSEIKQSICLANNSKRLDFQTEVDWHEKHRMLRVSFPVNVISEQAAFDIQYGYIKRNTHSNTSWDMAKFEVAGHRYADLSDPEYGVALLNDSKYGYRVYDNILDLNLLRSPTYPDPDADLGKHSFTYSLLPHAFDLVHSNVMAEASKLNQGIIKFDGSKFDRTNSPWHLEGEGLSLEVVKKAENENCTILRIIETHGKHSNGFLTIKNRQRLLVETNLMEWEDSKSIQCNKPVGLSLNPFEIKTFKLKD